MKNKKRYALLLCVLFALTMCLAGFAQPAAQVETPPAQESAVETAAEPAASEPVKHNATAETESTELDTAGFAGGQGTAEDPWQIATAEQLDDIRNHLDGHFVLSADIDLASYENWEPIGTYVPLSEEDHDTPVSEIAFTGTFDGSGNTVSNINISRPDMSSVGLFGCINGETCIISNLTVENATVEGHQLVSAVVGYAGFAHSIENITLTGTNNITGGAMLGGIVGGCMTDVIGCSAEADITYSAAHVEADASQSGVGVLIGGVEGFSITNCSAKGSITAEVEGVAGIGGLSGCSFSSPEVKDCSTDVTIKIGKNAKMIGGLLGNAGFVGEDEITVISGCSVNAVITAGEGTQRIGGIVGSGTYLADYKDRIPTPSVFKVVDCKTSGSIDGSTITGTIAGYTYDSIVENCESDMIIDGNQKAPQIGATADEVSLDELN